MSILPRFLEDMRFGLGYGVVSSFLKLHRTKEHRFLIPLLEHLLDDMLMLLPVNQI